MLPTAWHEREELREKGQFWTPDWVADAMVVYVMQGSDLIFDPGVGMGAFYKALRRHSPHKKFYGIDIDADTLDAATATGMFDGLSEIEKRDFILHPPRQKFKAIVANPPYIRHHRLSPEYKGKFQVMNKEIVGTKLDGRAGLHIYFLAQALNLLEDGGRLAFIMPADTCEGVFSGKLWRWISSKYALDGIVTFEHDATPFPGIDTNPIIFLIRKAPPEKFLSWIRCLKPNTDELKHLIIRNFIGMEYSDLIIQKRNLHEALATGLSRAPRKEKEFEYTLADFAHTMRGIATGANEFFFLTEEKAVELKIPHDYLLPAIGRTRDAEGDSITAETLEELKKKGRPVYLLYPNGKSWERLPQTVKNYLLEGERLGLPQRALISTRQPWYRMETRETPPFLFAYLGRRNTRFIRNIAGIVPLTGFLCVYPRSRDREYAEKLWNVLNHPSTVENLNLVGKSYGSGAIKVEPRALERLPINSELINKYGLQPIRKVSKLFSSHI